MSETLTRRLGLGLTALALAGLTATAAAAHAHLTASNPAANTTVAAPKTLSLSFNEPLEAKFSGLTLSGPGGAIKLSVSVPGDRKTILATPSSPLPAGAYKATWHAVAKDGHRMEGAIAFTVR